MPCNLCQPNGILILSANNSVFTADLEKAAIAADASDDDDHELVRLYHILPHDHVCMCYVVGKTAVFFAHVVDIMPHHLVVIAVIIALTLGLPVCLV